MYPNYFGLKEPSFSITPDPQYLFLSEQHREALAHLLYGAGEHGGFVLLTGEVGTGKTTVCRAFLEQLPEEVVVALILNPAMTVTELLRAVCDEFRIQVSDTDRTIQRLVDRLNRFLLDSHAKGRRTVLMIDEAQNLRPKVLEQVRLLTNLETAKHKLLQIFLVGQPELRALLQREGLRQLNQRITARYHLRPFNVLETAEYIRHRLAVAGVERPLFTRAALRRVFRLSDGIPRLINILCDRALLGACVTRSPLVTKRIVAKAAREVKDDGSWKKRSHRGGRIVTIAAALLLALGAGWLSRDWISGSSLSAMRDHVAYWVSPGEEPPLPDTPAESGASDEEGMPHATLAPVEEESPKAPAPDLETALMDQAAAMRLLLRRWGVEINDLGVGDPCERVVDFGLRCEREQGDWGSLRLFNRPALIQLPDAVGHLRYAVVSGLDPEFATLDLGEGSARLPVGSIDERWRGEFLVLWQPPPVGTGVIGLGASGEPVRWLRKLLSQVPELGVDASDSGFFDAALRGAVRGFQEQHGLKADGIAGPRTLIQLNNAVAMPEVPRLDTGL